LVSRNWPHKKTPASRKAETGVMASTRTTDAAFWSRGVVCPQCGHTCVRCASILGTISQHAAQRCDGFNWRVPVGAGAAKLPFTEMRSLPDSRFPRTLGTAALGHYA
jgi:DNA-directed RNA polymerase subunit RPC12/RpoP